jgi:hypothetical protein
MDHQEWLHEIRRSLGEGPSAPRDEWSRILMRTTNNRFGFRRPALATLSLLLAMILMMLVRPAEPRLQAEGSEAELDPYSQLLQDTRTD